MKPSHTNIQVSGEHIILATVSEDGPELGIVFSPQEAFKIGQQLMLVAKRLAERAAATHQN
jgi:hypothetical protein